MARLGESLTMNLTRSMAGSDRGVRWLRVIHEVAERGWGGTGPVCPPRGEPGDGERVAVGVSDAAQGIGGGGGVIAAGDVDVPPVGGGDEEPAVGAGLSRIAGEGAASAEVLHGLPGGGPNEGVVSGGVVPERGETGVVGGRKDKGRAPWGR